MREHFDSVEADFAAVYAIDLRDALWGENPVGVRRLNALVSALPADSATVRSVDPNDGWSQEDELLASIFDVVGMGNHLFLSANVQEKDRKLLPKPARFPRPWDEDEEEVKAKLSSHDEVLGFFGTMAAAGPDSVRVDNPDADPAVAARSGEGTN